MALTSSSTRRKKLLEKYFIRHFIYSEALANQPSWSCHRGKGTVLKLVGCLSPQHGKLRAGAITSSHHYLLHPYMSPPLPWHGHSPLLSVRCQHFICTAECSWTDSVHPSRSWSHSIPCWSSLWSGIQDCNAAGTADNTRGITLLQYYRAAFLEEVMVCQYCRMVILNP